ncbi:hypothetical protein [Mycobacterium marinum]|uniref:hypothetical protein n=1 Tax=Mycobacterium marinum TaxID=1781 RepID=UPI00356B577E
MGARTGYADGTFSWVDLATTEPEAATMFYGQLFGWTPEERRTADGRAYTVLCRDRQEVAGLYALPVADPAVHWEVSSSPGHWISETEERWWSCAIRTGPSSTSVSPVDPSARLA